MTVLFAEGESSTKGVTPVDMVAAMLCRRRLFLSVFALVLLGGGFLAALLPNEYEYVSLIQTALKGNQAQLELPGVSIETIKSRWLPEAKAQYAAEFSSNQPFSLTFSHPGSTGIVRIETRARQKHAEGVQYVHQALIDKFNAHQQALVTREMGLIERQIESTGEVISELLQQAVIPEAAGMIIEKRTNLELALEGLAEPRVLLVGQQSLEAKGPHRTFIFAVAIVFSLAFAVFMVILAEFVSVVRAKLASGSITSSDRK